MNFSLTNTTHYHPHISFEEIKDTILGKQYDLSLVLMGDALAKRLNEEHKHTSTPTNILSFPLDIDMGEIFINVRRAQRDADLFEHTPKQHIMFLFIHGCLHLSGMSHGDVMDHQEEHFLHTFS